MNRSIMRLIISLVIVLGILLIGPMLDTLKENKVITTGENRFELHRSNKQITTISIVNKQ